VLSKSLVPHFYFTKEYISILVAILGTTISPYLFFWQATMEAEEHNHLSKDIIVNKRLLGEMEVDVNIGMIFSNLVMFFIILTAGAVLHPANITEINTVDQAAEALRPLLGEQAYLFFALGVIGTGLLAIPVLAGAQSYLLSETFGWKAGLNKKFPQAKAFYLTIIISLLTGLSLDFLNFSPVKALLYTAILYGITAPVLIAIIIHIGNNKKIMGEYTNNALSNILGILTFLVVAAAAAVLIWFQFIG
jgi:Mn2+/Fe2+ NRAMP family transporter